MDAGGVSAHSRRLGEEHFLGASWREHGSRIGGLAPERRGEVAELGLRSIVSGTLASFSTACVAGMLL